MVSPSKATSLATGTVGGGGTKVDAGAIAAPTVNDTPTTAVAPPTLEDLRVIRRWHLRDKCLRVATYYRVMRLRARAGRAAQLVALRHRFADWAQSFVAHTHHTSRQNAHDSRAVHERASRSGHVSASTRMRMHTPERPVS